MRTKIQRLALLAVVMGGLLVMALSSPGERGHHPDLGGRLRSGSRILIWKNVAYLMYLGHFYHVGLLLGT